MTQKTAVLFLSFILLLQPAMGVTQSQSIPVPAKASWVTRLKFFWFDWRYLASFREKHAKDELQPILEKTAPTPAKNGGPALLAALQWSPSKTAPLDGTLAAKYLAENRDELAIPVREAAAQGAKIIVTPEYGITHTPSANALTQEEASWSKESLRDFAETVPGPSTEYFGRLAKELGIYLHINFAEYDPKDGTFYNALVALGPDGEIKAHHRKVNLFSTENNYLSAGTKATIYDSPYGKIALMVCADSYHLPLLDVYRKAGVDLVIVSAYWTIHNNALNWMRVSSRTMGVPLVISNQIEYPDSGVIQAKGEIQTHLRQSRGVTYGTLPKVSWCSKVHN